MPTKKVCDENERNKQRKKQRNKKKKRRTRINVFDGRRGVYREDCSRVVRLIAKNLKSMIVDTMKVLFV